nr:hypothetical protein [uncultured Faecalimonas sp.]
MKTKVVVSIALVIVLISGIAGCVIYQKQKEQTKLEQQRREAEKKEEEEKAVKKEIDKVSEKEKAFAKTEAHEEKLNLLKATLTEMEEYNSSKKHSPKVSEEYESVVSFMREAFQKEYDAQIAQDTLSDLASQEDPSIITGSKDKLTALLATMETEKEYVFASNDEFETYKQKITGLTEAYASRISEVEEAKKQAEEEAQRKAEEEARARTHYENEYFSVDVPSEWDGKWSISETENTMQPDNPRVVAAYSASCDPDGDDNGGGAIIHVLKLEEGDRLGYGYFSMTKDVECITPNASADNFVFIMTQAGAGFFKDNGAIITAK